MPPAALALARLLPSAGPFGLLCFGMTTCMLMVSGFDADIIWQHMLCATAAALTPLAKQTLTRTLAPALQFITTEWAEKAFLPTVFCYALFYGGAGQFVAGVLEVRGATALV